MEIRTARELQPVATPRPLAPPRLGIRGTAQNSGPLTGPVRSDAVRGYFLRFEDAGGRTYTFHFLDIGAKLRRVAGWQLPERRQFTICHPCASVAQEEWVVSSQLTVPS